MSVPACECQPPSVLVHCILNESCAQAAAFAVTSLLPVSQFRHLPRVQSLHTRLGELEALRQQNSGKIGSYGLIMCLSFNIAFHLSTAMCWVIQQISPMFTWTSVQPLSICFLVRASMVPLTTLTSGCKFDMAFKGFGLLACTCHHTAGPRLFVCLSNLQNLHVACKRLAAKIHHSDIQSRSEMAAPCRECLPVSEVCAVHVVIAPVKSVI